MTQSPSGVWWVELAAARDEGDIHRRAGGQRGYPRRAAGDSGGREVEWHRLARHCSHVAEEHMPGDTAQRGQLVHAAGRRADELVLGRPGDVEQHGFAQAEPKQVVDSAGNRAQHRGRGGQTGAGGDGARQRDVHPAGTALAPSRFCIAQSTPSGYLAHALDAGSAASRCPGGTSTGPAKPCEVIRTDPGGANVTRARQLSAMASGNTKPSL